MPEFLQRLPPALRMGLLIGLIQVVLMLLLGRSPGVALLVGLGWGVAMGGATEIGEIARSPGAWAPARWALPALAVVAGLSLGIGTSTETPALGLGTGLAAAVLLVGIGPQIARWGR